MWTGAAAATVRSEQWSYQVAKLESHPSPATRWPALAVDPALPATHAVRAGQALFVKDGFLPIAAPIPTIAKVLPKSGKPGATIAITGTNLINTTSVTFKGRPAKFKVVSGQRLTVIVPAKAKTGTFTVANPAGTASQAFTVK